jgi:hypothetical protein
MVLVEMSVAAMVCKRWRLDVYVKKGDRMVVMMLWRKTGKVIYARKWGHCRR